LFSLALLIRTSLLKAGIASTAAIAQIEARTR
jgi:hypothetical protein